MALLPPVTSLEPPPTLPPYVEIDSPGAPTPREYTGWVLLVILFAFSLSMALASSLVPGRAATSADHQQRVSTLRSSFDWNASMQSVRPGSKNPSHSEALRSLVDAVAPLKNATTEDANLWTAVTYELNGKISRSEIPKAASAPYQEIYGVPKLTPDAAKKLSRRLDSKSFLDQLAMAHAAQKAGNPGPYNQLGNASKGWWLIGGIFVGGLFMFGGIATGIALGSAQLAGKIRYRGHPQFPISALTADRLALRAAQLFVAFFIISLVPQLIGERRFSGVGVTFATGFATILAAIWLTRVPINGQRFSLASLGFTTQDLGRNVGLGLLAFVIELPIALIVGTIGTKIFSFLPEPHHPASDALANASLPAIAAVLFSASVVAPFWEEMMFRGLLFPAISRITPNRSKRVITGAIVSSLLFASVHPQGIALWFALGTVGLASCILVQYSRSLVPSMVMHAAHNFTLLVVTLVMTR